MRFKGQLLGTILLVAAIGCASTVVKKNPGQHDRGFRYYRPKPYLMIEPAGQYSTDTTMLKLSVTYLPDYNEEYSIHVRAGIGKNKTGFKLDNGWNLTSVDIDVDSQTDENITAAGNFLDKAGGLLKGGSGPATREVEGGQSMTVYGKHVPMGLYESVVGIGPDGCKRLCGWRYVGFTPFAGCATDVSQGCSGSNDLYGLISRGDQLVFEKLSNLDGITPKAREAVTTKPGGNQAPRN